MQVIVLTLVIILSLDISVQGACPTTDYLDPEVPASVAPSYTLPSPSEPFPSSLLTRDTCNEVVTFPYPDYNDATHEKIDCPYLDDTLKLWHDPSTWENNQLPNPGEDVTIPENTKVLISSCSVTDAEVYGFIAIPSTSSLIFADADINLHCLGIENLGNLTIGGPRCQVLSHITITLHGGRDASTFTAKEKGIVTSGQGNLDIHGVTYLPGFTRLAQTATAGDRTIFLQARVNWEVGHQVLITATELKDSRDWHRNEVREIEHITMEGDNVAILLNESLAYTHYGGKQYQAEVALLTRRIVIQGADDDSEPTDTSPVVCSRDAYTAYPCENTFLTGYGAHVMIDGQEANGRVAGVQFHRCGQTNVMGRYCFHFHHLQQGNESYIKDSSVVRSYFRAYTVHATHNTTVSNNVGYDIIGHALYMEDGVEENNTVSFNMIAHVHFLGFPPFSGAQFMHDIWQSENLLSPQDATASPFYITNMYNRFIGNAASGGYSGFALVRVEEPLLSSREPWSLERMKPASRPILEFDGNSAHSSGWWWHLAGTVYVGGSLRHESETSDTLIYNPGRDLGRETECWHNSWHCHTYPLYTNTKVFLGNWGINNWGKRSHIINSEVYDTMRPIAILGFHYVKNFLAVGRTGFMPERPLSPLGGALTWLESRWFDGAYMGFEWYDIAQKHILQNCTFRGFHRRTGPWIPDFRQPLVWRVLTHSDTYVPEFMQATKDIRYEDIDVEIAIRPSVTDRVTTSGRLASWKDEDGSVVGATTPQIIGSRMDGQRWWRLDDNCQEIPYFYSCDATSPITNNRRNVGSMYLRHYLNQGTEVGQSICSNGVAHIPCPVIGKVTHFGHTLEDGMDLTANTVVTGPVNGFGYFLKFDTGAPKSLNISRIQIAHTSEYQDFLLLAMPYPRNSAFTIAYESPSWCWWWRAASGCYHAFTMVDSVQSVIDNNKGDSYYWDNDQQLLYLRITQQQDFGLDFVSDNHILNEQILPEIRRDGVVIPVMTWGAQITIFLDSPCLENATNSEYCVIDNVESIQVPSPCEHGQNAYDECNVDGGNPTFNPTSGTQTTGTPTTGTPTTETPTTGTPTTGTPTTGTPTTGTPTTGTPTTGTPTTGMPTTGTPTTGTPTTGSPTTGTPTTGSPTTGTPTTGIPTTGTPTTVNPTSHPSTPLPTTSQPTTHQPTTSIPTNSPTILNCALITRKKACRNAETCFWKRKRCHQHGATKAPTAPLTCDQIRGKRACRNTEACLWRGRRCRDRSETPQPTTPKPTPTPRPTKAPPTSRPTRSPVVPTPRPTKRRRGLQMQ